MDEEEKIWKKQKQYKQENKINIEMTEEEIVEDAGLDEEIELTNKKNYLSIRNIYFIPKNKKFLQ